MSEQKPNGSKQKSWAVELGDRISEWTSRIFAHPYMQIGIILFCVSWFAIGLPTDLLTAALSILAITLTQMVLNTQYDREAEAHRRDVGMHAKLDELIAAKKGARNDLIGVEEKEEDEIVQLKDEVKEAIGDAAQSPDPTERAKAHRAIEKAKDELDKEVQTRSRKKASAKKASARA